MGLFQNAYETYERNPKRVGEYIEGQEPLAPVGHIITSAEFEVTIGDDGRFIAAAQRDKKAPKIIIPVTEESAARTSAPSPHPLCDQIGYLAAFDDKSRSNQQLYLTQLEEWMNSAWGDPKLHAVYAYVQSNALLRDLETALGIPFASDRNAADKFRRSMVIWKIYGTGGEPRVWQDVSLMEKYAAFALDRSAGNRAHCMISGRYEKEATQHMKGVFALNGNAKLISANDKTNFTYRGRFLKPEEALTVSYEASQKAHNALKWVISNQGVVLGGRAYLSWCPEGISVPMSTEPFLEAAGIQRFESTNPSDYRDQLEKALQGYQSKIADLVTSKTIIAAFDAATTGRLALTSYSEMATSDYFRRLVDWDQTCSWYFGRRGLILAPAIRNIARYAFGNERDRSGNGRIEIDDRVLKQQCDRLIHCRIGEAMLPADIVRYLAQKASNLVNYAKYSRENLLSIACAVIRKYHMDHGEEEWTMELDQEKRDRSYQYGRLLAVYEKVERDTYDREETREPNAMRLQSIYCRQPLHYAYELDKQMERAYFPRLKNGARVFYKDLIGEIMEQIHMAPEQNWNKPLEDTYLMGYYLQRKSLYTKKNEEVR